MSTVNVATLLALALNLVMHAKTALLQHHIAGMVRATYSVAHAAVVAEEEIYRNVIGMGTDMGNDHCLNILSIQQKSLQRLMSMGKNGILYPRRRHSHVDVIDKS